VPKDRFSSDDWYDVWYPELSPSPKLVSMARSAGTEGEWEAFVRAFRAEMNQPAASRTLDLLAALSHDADFLGRLLLRRRGTLPPLGAEGAAGRARGGDRLSV
jgi:uncharacterized protein YeaO (DUF488 family)